MGNDVCSMILAPDVLMDEPEALDNFKEHNVILLRPMVDYLIQLNNNRVESIERQDAKEALRGIYPYLYKNPATWKEGIRKASDLGTIYIANEIPSSSDRDFNSFFLEGAKKWINDRDKAKFSGPAKIITNRIDLTIKAVLADIPVEEYRSSKVISSLDELYSGHCRLKVKLSGKQIDNWKQSRLLPISELSSQADVSKLIHNQCCELVLENGRLLAIYKKDRGFVWVDKPRNQSPKEKHVDPLLPKNYEQCFTWELLNDPEITLLVLLGVAGSGKTSLALKAGYQQVKNGLFSQVRVYRPIAEMGDQGIGFLPGDLAEKMGPWSIPIIENLQLILGKNSTTEKNADRKAAQKFQEVLENQLVDVKPINFIRGITEHNKFLIIDDAQNYRPKHMRGLMTRPGQNTKVIVNGDFDQIDNVLDPTKSGLAWVVNNLACGWQHAAVVTLVKAERSELAERAANAR